MIHNIIKDKGTRLFIILGGFFIANAIIAEVIGVKIFSLEDTLGIEKANFSLLGAQIDPPIHGVGAGRCTAPLSPHDESANEPDNSKEGQQPEKWKEFGHVAPRARHSGQQRSRLTPSITDVDGPRQR